MKDVHTCVQVGNETQVWIVDDHQGEEHGRQGQVEEGDVDTQEHLK